MLFALVLIVVGVGLLVVGGETLLRGSVSLAKILKLTPAVIGLTVVAAGTSVPELAVSGIASFQGKTEIAVANVVGSNIFNIAVIVGLCALIRPLAITGNTIRLEYPVLALVTLMCVVICQDGEVNRLDAILFLAVHICFTAYLVSLVRSQVTAVEDLELRAEVRELTANGKQPSLAWATGLVVLGGALLALGAHSTVVGAVDLAKLLGLSERVIGLTIVSAGTGLPEVAASVVSSVRGRTDMAIGNVIGSNLFNMLVILGLNGLIAPLPVPAELIQSDCWWMLVLTLLLFPVMFLGSRVSRYDGLFLIAFYCLYIGVVLWAR